MDIDEKSKDQGPSTQDQDLENIILKEVEIGDEKNEEKKKTGVVETKQKDDGEGEGESRRRRVRDPGSVEKESPNDRRLRGTASTSSKCMDKEDQLYQQQQRPSGDGAPNSPHLVAAAVVEKKALGRSTLQQEMEWGRWRGRASRDCPKWPCRIEKVAEEPVVGGDKEGKEMGQMAVVHFFGLRARRKFLWLRWHCSKRTSSAYTIYMSA